MKTCDPHYRQGASARGVVRAGGASGDTSDLLPSRLFPGRRPVKLWKQPDGYVSPSRNLHGSRAFRTPMVIRRRRLRRRKGPYARPPTSRQSRRPPEAVSLVLESRNGSTDSFNGHSPSRSRGSGQAKVRYSEPCAGCSCARARPVAPVCRGPRSPGHSRSHVAACGPNRAWKLFGVIGPPRSDWNTYGDGPHSRCRRRSARNSSPRSGCTLGVPFFARRTCRRPVASST